MNNKSTDMQVYNESKKSNKNLLVYYSKRHFKWREDVAAVALYIFKIMFIKSKPKLPTGHMLSLVESAQDSKTTHKNKLKNQMEHE